MAATCLSFHASYRCRHAGACCETAWDIEIDAPIVAAVSLGRLKPVSVTPAPFIEADETGRTFVAPARTEPGLCGFRHDQRCSLQVVGGEEMLPSACRHFPRVYRREPHRERLTLSHYCPTAATLLLDRIPVAIVPAEPPLALATAEGLDVTQALPPLLRPGMLMDHQGYDAWEDLVVSSFAGAPTVVDGFAIVTSSTERIRRWHPRDGCLESAVRAGFAGAAVATDCERLSSGFRTVVSVTGPHPLLEVPADFAVTWRHVAENYADLFDEPLRRYLAASAFGNWVAYRGQGLRSTVEWIRACFDVFRLQLTRRFLRDGALTAATMLEAFRDSDYLMIHTVDSLAFGRAIATVE